MIEILFGPSIRNRYVGVKSGDIPIDANQTIGAPTISITVDEESYQRLVVLD